MTQKRRFLPLAEAQKPFFVGVDVGGTNIKVGVVDDLGRPLSWHSIPTRVKNGAEDASQRMGLAIHEAIRLAGLTAAAVARVGLGSAGPLDIPAGRLVKPTNLKGWDDFPIRDRVAQHCGLPVSFANDASAAAFGELWVGSGRELQSLVLLTLGTGVGCGIIIDQRTLQGEHSHGGEFAHTIIDCAPDARVCGCGRRGHFEAYVSATALVGRTREALDAGRPSSLSRRIAAGDALTPILVAEEAQASDALSLEIIAGTACYLGIGVVNLMHTVDPAGVLLGGAMTFGGHETELGRQFLAQVKAEIAARAFPVLVANTRIDFATLGGDAGYIGAAGIARRDHLQAGVP